VGGETKQKKKKKLLRRATSMTSWGPNLCEFVNGEKAGEERPENTQTRRMAKRRNNRTLATKKKTHIFLVFCLVGSFVVVVVEGEKFCAHVQAVGSLM
jgi:hypothetical protein